MAFFLHVVHPVLMSVVCVLIACIAWWRKYRYQSTRYVYPLSEQLHVSGFSSPHMRTGLLWLLRMAALLGMAILIARLQWVDSRSKVTVDGIDIMLVLDVSDSMQWPHHKDDQRSRISVAKEEAIRFIQERTHDAVGLVVFGQDALSRCPLTADKNMLRAMIDEVDGSLVGPCGTVLCKGILTALNRLKHSKARSKIMIVLTDGEPTEQDINPAIPLEAAKQLGVKIYTVGIGGNQEIIVQHPFYGPVQVKTQLNTELLTKLAEGTGGNYFEVKNAHDMRDMYTTIHSLETTNIETPVFAHYYELCTPLIWGVLCLLISELFLSSLLWFGL